VKRPMLRVRRALVLVSALWLSGQLVTMAATPLAIWLGSAETATHAAECTCIHGQDAACPMHHRPAGSRTCVVQSAAPPAVTLLTLLVGAVALLPGSIPLTTPNADEGLTVADPSMRPPRSTSPESPPPRA